MKKEIPGDILNAGLRPTPARCRILETLRSSRMHLTTDEIRQELADTGTSMPAATLYQNLDRLTSAGLLIRFTAPDGQIRYDANLETHQHLICLECGKILDVQVCTPLEELEMVSDIDSRPVEGWSLQKARIALKGICPDCRAKI